MAADTDRTFFFYLYHANGTYSEASSSQTIFTFFFGGLLGGRVTESDYERMMQWGGFGFLVHIPVTAGTKNGAALLISLNLMQSIFVYQGHILVYSGV